MNSSGITPSFFSENKLLNKLRPSHAPSPRIAALRQIGARISKFFTIQFPDAMKGRMPSVIRSSTSPLAKASVDSLWGHYRKFLENEVNCPPGLVKAFKQMHKLEQKYNKMQLQVSQNADKKEMLYDFFIADLKDEIASMAKGDSRIIASPAKDFFYVITHETAGYTLSILGSGEKMKALGIEEIRFEKIPIKTLMDSRFLNRALSSSVSSLTEDDLKIFEKYAVKAPLQSSSERTHKLFWNVVKALPSTKGEVPELKTEAKRVQLRSELLTLFDQFSKERFDLKPASRDYEDLKNLHEGVSNRMLAAYHKGYLKFDEMQEIKNELKVIHDALLEVKREPPAFISNKINVKDYLFKGLFLENFGVKPLPEVSDEPVVSSVNVQIRQSSPPDVQVGLKIQPVDFHPFARISTADEYLKEFKAAIENWKSAPFQDKEKAALNVLKFMHEVPFNFSDKNSFWWKVSPEQARGIMRDINLFSTEFTKHKNPANLSAFQMHALLKMTYTVQFFNAVASGKWIEVKVASQGWRFSDYWIDDKGRRDFQRVHSDFFQEKIDLEEAESMKRAFKHIQSYECLNKSGGHLTTYRNNESWTIDGISFVKEGEEEIPSNIQKLKKEDYEPLFQHLEIRDTFFNQNSHEVRINIEHTLNIAQENRIRPIKDPYLYALYRLVIHGTDIEGHETLLKRTQAENFRNQPEDVLEFVLKWAQDLFPAADVNTAPLEFTSDQIKALSRLLREENAQVEILTFMQQNPTLMLNPNVRNFVDALFFSPSLTRTLSVGEWGSFQFAPQQIEKEIEKLEARCKKELEKAELEAPEETAARIETLSYYIEMQEKLREIYRIVELRQSTDTYLKERGKVILASQVPAQKERLQRVLKLTEGREELVASRGYTARVALRSLLLETPLNLPEVMKSLASLKAVEADPRNIDPYFEEQINLKWDAIVKAMPQDLSGQDLKSILDFFTFEKNLPIDSSQPWEAKGNFTFENNKYVVDLKSWKIALKGTKGSIESLPVSIRTNLDFQEILGEEYLNSIRVTAQEGKEGKVFDFKDRSNVPVRIAENQGEYALYKKVGHKWVQSVPPSLFAPEALKQLERKYQANRSLGILSFLEDFKKVFSNAAVTPYLPLLEQGIYVDPAHPKTGLILNVKGDVDFEILFKQTDRGLIVDEIRDRRGEKPSTLQVSSAAFIKKKSLNFLEAFENKENILLFSEKGKLSKVELPRYGLKFDLVGGRLICSTPPYQGYAIDPKATLSEKQGMKHALLLQPQKADQPKKLLIPETQSIEFKPYKLIPKAYGLAKVSLFFHRLKQIIKATQGDIKELPIEIRGVIDPELKRVPFVAFTLRPYTGEICEKKPQEILHAVKQALMTDQAARAFEIIQRIDISPLSLDANTTKELITFLKEINSSEKAGLALKMKVALALMDTLQRQNRLDGNTKAELKAVLNEAAKVPQGKKTPEALRLNFKEMDQLKTLFGPEFVRSFLTYEPLEVIDISGGKQVDSLREKVAVESVLDRPVIQAAGRNQIIEKLEEKLQVSVRLIDGELTAKIPLLKQDKPLLLFSAKADVAGLFEDSSKKILPKINLNPDDKILSLAETAALDNLQGHLDSYSVKQEEYVLKRNIKGLTEFQDKVLIPKLEQEEGHVQRLKKEIELIVNERQDLDSQLKIYAGREHVPSMDELRLDFLQGNIVNDQLQEKLFNYFDHLSKRNAADFACSKMREVLGAVRDADDQEWGILSNGLHQVLTFERGYDAKKEPRLLVFEAQQFKIFKPLEGGLNQLDLLASMVTNPHELILAPTGSGKTAVISVMGSLLRANGNNLIIQKVMPALLDQTKKQLNEVFGGLYNTFVYDLRLNGQMRFTEKEVVVEIDDDGKEVETIKDVSIFKGIYCNLLQVMENKGTVLTEYKTLPFIEQRYFALGKRFEEGDISPLDREEFTYLRKLLILFENKGIDNMDEFDGPNRPTQKNLYEMPGVVDATLPTFMMNTSLEIFDLLTQEENLGLKSNIQGDIRPEERQKALEKVARSMANKLSSESSIDEGELFRYLTGQDEAVLDKLEANEFGDRVVLCKDQLSKVLPLTLAAKEGARYQRSKDGSKTVPCQNGVAQEEAKHGTPLERINYTMQDYLQKGVTAYDIKLWLNDLKEQWDKTDNEDEKMRLQAQFEKAFPGRKILETVRLMKKEEGMRILITEVNQHPKRVEFFLKKKLDALKPSGSVISMDPLDIVNMDRSTSGISATMAAPETMHRDFEVDTNVSGAIHAGMVYRIVGRAIDQEVIKYDPVAPEKIFKQDLPQLHAVIDGAGAFSRPPSELLEKRNGLKQVGYIDENQKTVFMGEATGELDKTGFFFPLSQTRGTDRELVKNANAILTLSEQDGLNEYFQKEGRLRQATQKYLLAMSKYLDISTVSEEITHAVSVDAKTNGKDIYRNCSGELDAVVRKAKRTELLKQVTPEDFAALFRDPRIQRSFINPDEPSYSNSGDYFKRHKHIERQDQDTHVVLEDKRKALKADVKALVTDGLLPEDNSALQALKEMKYPPELLAKMEPKQTPFKQGGELGLELHMQQEQELKQELQVELEKDTELQLQQPDRPARKQVKDTHKRVEGKDNYALRDLVELFDPRLLVTDNFIRVAFINKVYKEENQVPKIDFQKKLQASKYEVGEVYVKIENETVQEMVIEDPLTENIKKKKYSFVYDIRSNQITYQDLSLHNPNIVKSPEFIALIAQVKFFDGRVNNYSSDELDSIELWVKKEGLQQIENYFLNNVLVRRPQFKDQYEGSQLQELFNRFK